MDENLVCVKYVTALNEAAKKTFKRMQRVKFTCFTVSRNFLAFGASSGGIYVFQRECCKFLKFLPHKESSINLISISTEEKNLGIATATGLIVVVENFLIESDSQSKVYQEHSGAEITCLRWQGNDLYIGDSKGKVSVITVGIDILPKTLFQLPLTTILHLDSSIVQMDIYRHYLLVSTRFRTFICDTQKEFYLPIGKKSRDGFFGACFYGPKLDSGYTKESNTLSDKTRGIYRTFNENEFDEDFDINNECVIFCARPGVRLWQANFDGSVEVTYQFKNSMQQKPTDLIVISQKEETRLQIISHGDATRVPDNNFHFGNIFPICGRFILTYTSNGLYVFDPQASELRFWINFHCDIKQIEISESIIFVWTTDLEISLISLVYLEELLLRCLYKKQYMLCADACLHFNDAILALLETSNKLYLLTALRNKITEEKLLKQLDPIFQRIEETNNKLNCNQLEIEANDVEWETLDPNDLVKSENTPIVVGETPENKTEEKNDLKLFTKQYRLHKTHRNINIPDFDQFLQRSNLEEIFALVQEFIEHISKEYSEDATEWCQEIIFKQVDSRKVKMDTLSHSCLEFIRVAFLSRNKDLDQYSCQCEFPLPNCHNFKPKHHKIGLALLDIADQRNIVLKKIPYFLKFFSNTKTELNLPLTVQFCDKKLFTAHLTRCTYDVWDQAIRLFVKLNQGHCLNCDRKIDLKGVLSWTDFALLILQSLGAQHTLKLLKRYSNSIPNGALNQKFYETCIFMATFDCGTTCQDPRLPVDFINSLDMVSLVKLQKSLVKHLDKKYLETDTPSIIGQNSTDTGQKCSYCNLPLSNAILGSDRRFILECAHQFHSICFSRNNRLCHICK